MKHILQLLDHTVRRWGSRPAFGDEHRTLTWNEVEDAVQRIGTALAGYGVQRRPVAIYLDHEVPCLLAMLGTLAAGGFYTVLDTAQPPRPGAADHRPALPRPAGDRRRPPGCRRRPGPCLPGGGPGQGTGNCAGRLSAADAAGAGHRHRPGLCAVHLRLHRHPQGGGHPAPGRAGLQRLERRGLRHR